MKTLISHYTHEPAQVLDAGIGWLRVRWATGAEVIMYEAAIRMHGWWPMGEW
jgi:hypothetical protein